MPVRRLLFSTARDFLEKKSFHIDVHIKISLKIYDNTQTDCNGKQHQVIVTIQVQIQNPKHEIRKHQISTSENQI